MHLTLYVAGAGHFESAWRFPRTEPAQLSDVRWIQRAAQQAEQAGFDALFIADSPFLYGSTPTAGYYGVVPFEPFTLLSAVAAVTSRIGLIGTASTTYGDPFSLARSLASLDHISGGRAGWNIVTTSAPEASRNFGADEHMDHSLRYERAAEFVDVVTRLWDSWDDGAVIADRTSGRFLAADGVRPIDHVGRWFSVRGPLTMPRPPQGHPVRVQAGSSGTGQAFAARYGEVVFTAQQTITEAREFSTRTKDLTRAAGRNPEHLKILPGVVPVIGSTQADAERLYDDLFAATDIDAGLDALQTQLGIDLRGHGLDTPFPHLDVDAFNGAKSRAEFISGAAKRDALTIRQVIRLLVGGRGHRVFVGTPEQFVADARAWTQSQACDGFTILPPYHPGGLDTFVEEVVPLLQRDGLLRTEYSGATLRDHFGLPRP